jgi:hypothetical protein
MYTGKPERDDEITVYEERGTTFCTGKVKDKYQVESTASLTFSSLLVT